MAGLKDGTLSISGDYESSDVGQTTVMTAFNAGTACYIKVLWNGTAGHKVQCVVESYDLKAAVDGKVEWSATLQFNGAPVAV
jgi:predicted secreted protein